MNVEESKQDQFRKLIFISQKIGGIRKFLVKDLAQQKKKVSLLQFN